MCFVRWIRLFQTLSGFRTVGRYDVGKALVQSHEVAFRRDDVEIDVIQGIVELNKSGGVRNYNVYSSGSRRIS